MYANLGTKPSLSYHYTLPKPTIKTITLTVPLYDNKRNGESYIKFIVSKVTSTESKARKHKQITSRK